MIRCFVKKFLKIIKYSQNYKKFNNIYDVTSSFFSAHTPLSKSSTVVSAKKFILVIILKKK